MKSPYINIILGPMSSGKSTELVRLINREKSIKTPIIVINHSSDTRYGKNKLTTHDKISIDSISLDKLMDIINDENYIKSKIIFIEEAQFFNDLFDFVKYSINKCNKSLVIAALDGDFKQEPFDNISKVIPLADNITKLNALCSVCNDGTPAPFTMRNIKTNDKILVGGLDIYIPVCREHFFIH